MTVGNQPEDPETEPSRDFVFIIRQMAQGMASGASMVGAQIGKIYGNVTFVKQDQRAIQDRQDKLALLQRVKLSWIEGRLHDIETVHQGICLEGGLLDLPKHWRPDLVQGEPAEIGDVSLWESPEHRLDPGTRIDAIFDNAGGSLLILGEPGSGKSVLLLQLAREAIRRALDDEDQPIPVVLHLGSWTEERASLEEWLVHELGSTKYQVPPQTARRWLEDHDLLLLLDGLGELARSDREACVRAINRFLGKRGLTRIAVSCRVEQYSVLQSRLALRRAVVIERLSREQIDTFFREAGSSLANLHLALKEDPPLLELARTPLMLNIMARTYRDMPRTGLNMEHLDTTKGRRKQIFTAYVEQMFRGRAQDRPWDDGQTRAWLSWLARSMSAEKKSPYLIEEMEPSWLPGRWPWVYVILSRLEVGLLGGLVGGTIIGLGTYAEFGPGIDLVREWLIPGLGHGLLEGLLGGLVAGLVVGLLDILWIHLVREGRPIGRLSPAWRSVVKLSLIALIVSPAVALLFRLILGRGWLIEGLNVGLAFALSAGLLFAIGPKGVRHHLSNDIQPVERIQWEYEEAVRGALLGIAAGAIAGAAVAVVGQGTGLVSPLVNAGLSTGARILAMMGIGMFFLGLVGLVFRGLTGTLTKVETIIPNEGLRLSILNSLLTTPVIGLAFGLAGLGLGSILGGARVAVTYCLYGLFLGVLAGLWYGGVFFVQHSTLRLILWGLRYTPRPGRLVPFLDYAARRILLLKVGGGYLFFDRYLQDHFAELNLLVHRHDQ